MAFRVTELMFRLSPEAPCIGVSNETCKEMSCDPCTGGGCDSASGDCIVSECPDHSLEQTLPPWKKDQPLPERAQTLALMKAELREELDRVNATSIAR
jgi:hypothetical protein